MNFIKAYILILTTLFIFLGCSQYIKEPQVYNKPLIEENTLVVNFSENRHTEITRQEFVQAYAKNKNIYFGEADILVAKQSEASLDQLPQHLKENVSGANTIWLTTSWEQAHPRNPNFSTIMTGFIEVWHFGSFKQINNATVTSYLGVGQPNSTWVQANFAVSPTGGSFPTNRVTFAINGHFTTEVNHFPGVNVNMPGFNIMWQEFTKTKLISDITSIQRDFTVDM